MKKYMLLGVLSLIFLIISQNIIVTSSNLKIKSNQDENNSIYAYIVDVKVNQSNDIQKNICKFVNELLNNKIDVYWISKDLDIKSIELQGSKKNVKLNFEKGSFIIPIDKEKSKNILLSSIALRYKVNYEIPVFIITQPVSNLFAYKLVEPKILVHNGPGVESYSYYNCLYEGGFKNYNFSKWDKISNNLNNIDYNIFILGGSIANNFENIYSRFLYRDAIVTINNFIKKGGGYVGSCYGSIIAASGPKYMPINLIQSYLKGNNIPPIFSIGCDYTISDLKTNYFSLLIPPNFITHKIINNKNPVTYGIDEYIKIEHVHGPAIEYTGTNTEPLAIYYEVDDDLFLNTKIPNLIKNNWLKNTVGKTSIVASKLGKGKVVTFGSHPEIYFNTDRYLKYPSTLRLVFNALFYVTSEEKRSINISNKLNSLDGDLEIIGPDCGNIYEEYDYHFRMTGGEPPYKYLWSFSDNTNSNKSDPSHIFNKNGTFSIILTLIDENNSIKNSVFQTKIVGDEIIENNPPDTPIEQYGCRIKRAGKKICFFLVNNDTDGDRIWTRIQYKIDDEWIEVWDDFENESKFLFDTHINGECAIRLNEEGMYHIRFKAIDEHGAESEWSEPTKIFITKYPLLSKILNYKNLEKYKFF